MVFAPSPEQLTGLNDSHLVTLPSGHRLVGEVAEAFLALRADAARSGFDLAIASSFRSFERQLRIWNGKASGVRPVHDDAGQPLALDALSDAQRLFAILRFSALPGTSRHHWGTDLDVYDAAVVPEDYEVTLSPVEVAPEGIFGPLHSWLDERMAAGRSHGFFRPYGADRGGIAPERWHLSYAPLARQCAAACGADLLRVAWDSAEAAGGLMLRSQVESHWDDIYTRYICVPPDWAPA